ncbi:MAG: MBL fold metallo-hydrolase [Candidatus Omnitrophica bacterium]|nr:MBL fold metallo-hydrolase [Candidatus Omnitrophota bacterium]MDD5436708.1 MBL fold metallo-hydrolase [Candidatus Omnitrophota bacterium]
MKIRFLGTNGWYDTKTANTVCAMVETDEYYIILDAGSGFYKTREYIKDGRPVLLFLSHLHLDHIIGLHTLPLFNIPQGIDVYMPGGMTGPLKTFLSKPYTSPLDTIATRVRLHEIDTERPPKLDCRFGPLLHSPTCYGYRLRLEGKTISYCTDTGICDELCALAKDCDLLITECSFKPGEDVSKASHLNPEAAAGIAKECGVKKLGLIHFDAGRYPSLKDRGFAENTARKIFPNTFAATDDQELKL